MVDVFHGMFAANSLSGDQQVTGIGFSGKVFIFYSVNQTNKNGSYSGHYRLSFGFADGVTKRSCAVSMNSSDIVTNSDVGLRNTRSGCIMFCTASGTLGPRAGLKAVDGDSFTLSWNNQLASLSVSGWIGFDVFGGSDIVNHSVITFSGLSGAVSQTVNGVGFSGNVAILCCSNTPTDTTNTLPPSFAIGMATGPSERATISIFSEDAQANADTFRWPRTDRVLAIMNNNGVAVTQADFTNFHSDGITINWISGIDTLLASGLPIHLLVMKVSGNAKVKSWNTISGTGNQTINGVGFSGKYMFLMSTDTSCNNTDTSLSNNRISIGSAISSASRGAVWAGDQDGVGTMVNTRGTSDTKTFIAAMENTTDSSTSGTMIADFVQFNSDGYVLDKSTNAFNGDTSGMTISSLVIGDTISGAAVEVVADVQRRAFGGANSMQFPSMAMGDFGGHMHAESDSRAFFGQPRIPQPMINVSGQLYY